MKASGGYARILADAEATLRQIVRLPDDVRDAGGRSTEDWSQAFPARSRRPFLGPTSFICAGTGATETLGSGFRDGRSAGSCAPSQHRRSELPSRTVTARRETGQRRSPETGLGGHFTGGSQPRKKPISPGMPSGKFITIALSV